MIVVVGGLAPAATVEVARAQEIEPQTARDWPPVAPIPDTYEDALPPYMAVDENKTVHAFTTMPLSFDPADPLNIERAIYYRQWTLEGGWSEPVDIMLTPLARQARVKGVHLDKAGILHLLFFGGDDNEANIYYSWAPAADAFSAQAWSPPIVVGPAAITPEVAAITGDGEDHLVVMYSGNLGEGKTLYVVYSDDAGVTWSEPQLLYSTYSLESQVLYFHLFYGESGTLHVMWNTVDMRGQNVNGFYTQLKDMASRQWTEPRVIAESVELGFAAPSVIEYNGDVMVFYNNGVPGQVAPVMWFIRSTDGGKTFSQPVQAFPNHIGRNGAVSFVVDSTNTLHAFWGQRIGGGLDGTTDLHGMWHSIWDGQSWGPARPVVTGPSSTSFDPADATAVAVQGNVILLTYRTDPGRKVRNSWFTYQVLENAPELPVKPLPTPSVSLLRGRNPLEAAVTPSLFEAMAELAGTNITTTTTVSEPTPIPTPAPTLVFSKEPGASTANPGTPLLGALVPTVLFVLGALMLGSLRRQKS
jgi:hypothetical protein